VPEELYYDGINVINSWGLDVPKIAVEELTAQKPLPDDAEDGFIMPDRISKVGESPQKNQNEPPIEPGARVIRNWQIGNSHTSIFFGATISRVNPIAGQA
jgi:hypothetical protein